MGHWYSSLQIKASMYEKAQRAIHQKQVIDNFKVGAGGWQEVSLPTYREWSEQVKFPFKGEFKPKCLNEHQADALRVDHLDGVFVSYCRNCDIKLVFEKVPGQFPKVKIMGLLTDVMMGKAVDSAEVLEVRVALQKERELLERAESDYRLMVSIIGKDYEDKEGIPLLPEM